MKKIKGLMLILASDENFEEILSKINKVLKKLPYRNSKNVGYLLVEYGTDDDELMRMLWKQFNVTTDILEAYGADYKLL